jgi:outer membrane protein assembly factor BamB
MKIQNLDKWIFWVGIIGFGCWLGWPYISKPVNILLALNADTGRVGWLQMLPKRSFSQGPIVADGKVLLSYSDDDPKRNEKDGEFGRYHLQLFDAQSGQTLWNYTYVSNEVVGGFRMAFNKSVFFLDHQILVQIGNQLHSLNVATGRAQWSIQRQWDDEDLPRQLGVLNLANRNQLLVQPRQSRESTRPDEELIQLLDSKTGRRLNQFVVPQGKAILLHENIVANNRSLFIAGFSITPANELNGRRYNGHIISAYDIQTGKLQFRQGFSRIGRIQIGGDTLQLTVYGNTEHSFLALDSKTGGLLWQKN